MSLNKEVDLMKVLAKYIAHVSLEEGANYIDKISEITKKGYISGVEFTEKELEALHFAEDLAHSKYIDQFNK